MNRPLGYYDDEKYTFKYTWKVIEKKEKRHDYPCFVLYRKVYFIWCCYGTYSTLEECKTYAVSFEKFMERESYEKEIWSSRKRIY